jgi:hypothetical protein
MHHLPKRRWLYLLPPALLVALCGLWLYADFHSARGRYNRIEVGMTEEQVVDIIGEYPDSNSWSPGTGEATAWWNQPDGEVYVTFDSAGHLWRQPNAAKVVSKKFESEPWFFVRCAQRIRERLYRY